MRRLLVLLPAISSLFAQHATFPAPAHNFGKVLRGAKVEHDFVVRNTGKAPLKVTKVDLTAPLLVSRIPPAIPPGGEGKIRVVVDTAQLTGAIEGKVVVHSNAAKSPATLSFNGLVSPPVEITPLTALFISANRGEAKQSSVDIVNHESAPLKIHAIEHPQDRFTTRLDTVEPGRRFRLNILIKPDAAPGRKADIILLKTSSALRPQIRLTATTLVRDRVYTFPETLDLGQQSASGPPVPSTLMVFQRGGKDFQILKVESDIPSLRWKMQRAETGDRVQIQVTLAAGAPHGPLKGLIRLKTNDPKISELSVPVRGLVIR